MSVRRLPTRQIGSRATRFLSTTAWSSPATVGLGESVTALSAQVIATPQKGVVEKVYKTDEDQGLEVGSVVYALYPIGEGAVAVWHEGKVKRGSLDLTLRYDEPLAARPLEWTWRVQVRLADGRTGWIKNPQRQFDGMDARANQSRGDEQMGDLLHRPRIDHAVMRVPSHRVPLNSLSNIMVISGYYHADDHGQAR